MSAQRPSKAFQASRRADRPRGHAGTSDAEKLVFAATERLLEDVPLHEISVAQIIKEAGVSRATFYFYFSSKYAVVAALLAKVMDEIYDVVEPFRARKAGDAPEVALREALGASLRVWREHRPALRATTEHWHAVPELRGLWAGVVERFTQAFAAEIERERKAGAAPPGPDSRQLAAALVWGTERALYVAGLGVDDDLPSEEEILDPLLALWLGALYGAAPAAPKAARAGRGGTRKAPAKASKRAA